MKKQDNLDVILQRPQDRPNTISATFYRIPGRRDAVLCFGGLGQLFPELGIKLHNERKTAPKQIRVQASKRPRKGWRRFVHPRSTAYRVNYSSSDHVEREVSITHAARKKLVDWLATAEDPQPFWVKITKVRNSK